MIATIVYSNTAHSENPGCTSLYPNVCEYVCEYNYVNNLRYKIIDLQYFLYRPDYILVEFNGKIYDATEPNTKDSKELFKKLTNGSNKGKYDRNYNLAFS